MGTESGTPALFFSMRREGLNCINFFIVYNYFRSFTFPELHSMKLLDLTTVPLHTNVLFQVIRNPVRPNPLSENRTKGMAELILGRKAQIGAEEAVRILRLRQRELRDAEGVREDAIYVLSKLITF